MKNIKYLAIISLFGFLGVSCSLEEKSYTEIDMDEYMNNASEANTVLTGIYADLCEEGMYRYNLSCLLQMPTDMEKCEGSTTDNYRIVPANAYTSVQSDIEITWEDINKAIYDANSFIRQLSLNVENFDEDDKPLATVYMGEARALRALCYFELVRWFGNVTLNTDPMYAYKTPLTEMEQDDPVEVYEQIEKDLLYAVDVLPYATDDNLRASNDYRFSKGAALGLLTKVYATWAGYPLYDESKWELAAETAKTLIESGKHGLLTEGIDGDSGYEQLWWNTCNGVWDPTESLIEISFYSPTSTATGARLGRIGKWNGVTASNIRGVRNAGNIKAIAPFVQDWKDRAQDLRVKLSVADYKYLDQTKTKYDLNANTDPNTPARYYKPYVQSLMEQVFADESNSMRTQYSRNLTPAKWDTEKYVKDANYLVDQNLSNVNWYVLRYADVMLLYAEALNEINQGPNATAYEMVNMVRRRGFGLSLHQTGKADLASGMGYEEFKQAIRDERGYELAFEGHRRQDLIRWGIYYETVMQTAQEMENFVDGGSSVYIASRYTQKGKHELLPIPQREMQLMPKYKQNPGW